MTVVSGLFDRQIEGSCSICFNLHIPCVGSGRRPPEWHKVRRFHSIFVAPYLATDVYIQSTVLGTLCRRLISDQIKHGRGNQNRTKCKSFKAFACRSPADSQASTSVQSANSVRERPDHGPD